MWNSFLEQEVIYVWIIDKINSLFDIAAKKMHAIDTMETKMYN